MTDKTNTVNVLNSGVENVLQYDNIAIVVLMIFVILEAGLIAVLLKRLFKIIDVLGNLNNAITILNERIRHYDDEHERDN